MSRRTTILAGISGAVAFVLLLLIILANASTSPPIAHTVQATARPKDIPTGLPTAYGTAVRHTPTPLPTPGNAGGETPVPVPPTTIPSKPHPTHVPHPTVTPHATATATVIATATTVPSPGASPSPGATATTLPTPTTAPSATATPSPTATPVPAPVFDPLDDKSLMYSYTLDASTDTPAFYFDTSNPQFFGGDTSRLVRKVGFYDVSAEYHVAGARTVTVRDAEANRGQAPGQMYQPLLIEASANGQDWTPVDYSVPDPEHFSPDWFGYTLDATLPSGTVYERVGWTATDTASSSGDSNWTTQLMSVTFGF